MRVAGLLAVVLSCSSDEGRSNVAEWPTEPCPPGTWLVEGGCRPEVILDCPAGTAFREGIGCVAVVAPSAPTASSAAPVASTPAGPSPSATAVTPPPNATAAEPPGPCGCKQNDAVCIMACGPRPPPIATSSATGAFDRVAASHALMGAARAAQACRRIPGPTGPGSIVVVFEPSGVVSRATVSEPYKDTPAGTCVERLFLQATVPAFRGDPVSVTKTFRIE